MHSDHPDAATPLDPDEVDGLIPTHITTRAELDRWEQRNIMDAHRWLVRGRPKAILTVDFVRKLHHRMFRDVWKWAGQFRRSEKNIGVHPWQIAEEAHKLCHDARYWIEHDTYPPDEIAIRFHHRLVSIHPFPNGNGRHARLMADLIAVVLLHRPRFSWGQANLAAAGSDRQRYIEALHAADHHDIEPLIQFARS